MSETDELKLAPDKIGAGYRGKYFVSCDTTKNVFFVIFKRNFG